MRKFIVGMLLVGAMLAGCGGQTGVDGAVVGPVPEQNSLQKTTKEIPQEVKDIMVAFYTAYFDAEGSADKLQPYLSETFAYEVELYHDIEPNSTIYGTDDLEVCVIKMQSSDIKGVVGDECILALEFRFPNEDSLTYLTTKFVRESSGWKIASYGLEK